MREVTHLYGEKSIEENKVIEEKINPQEGRSLIMITGWQMQRKESSDNTYMM